MLILSRYVRLGGTFSITLSSFVFSPPILASSLSPSNVYLFAGDCWWKGRLSVGWRSGAKSAVGRVKGLLCSATFSLFSIRFPFSLTFFRFFRPVFKRLPLALSRWFLQCRLFPLPSPLPVFCLPSLFLSVDLCWRTLTECCSLTSPHMPRITDVLTLTKGYSPGLPASQVPHTPTPTPTPPTPRVFCRSPGGFRFATDSVRHFLGKTFRLPWDLQRPFTSRLTRRKVDTARLWWLDCNWSAHFLSVLSPSWLLNVSLQELK